MFPVTQGIVKIILAVMRRKGAHHNDVRAPPVLAFRIAHKAWSHEKITKNGDIRPTVWASAARGGGGEAPVFP